MTPAVVSQTLLDKLDRLEAQQHPGGSPQTQRQFQRFAVRADAELHPMTRSRLDSTPIEIKLRDIGRGGFGFVAEQAIELDTSWRCCFLDRGYVVGEQACVVRHCHQIGPRLFLAGAQIVLPTGLMVNLGVDPVEVDLQPIRNANGQDAGFEAPTDCA